MAARDPLRWPLVVLLFGGAATAALGTGAYGKITVAEIAVYCLFALSIDFLVGYTGLVTFGHAGFMGVGAYGAAYFSHFLGWPVGAAMAMGVLLGTVAGVAVGFLVTRVRGVFFIMVTLAFSMMFYSWANKAWKFGADDGLAGMKRLDLRAIGINLEDPTVWALFLLLIAFGGFLVFERLVNSPFGQVLKAIKQNENRIRAQGCPTWRYKLAAFTVASAAAALAGTLHLQTTKFLHPEIAFWIKSGEGLIYVIVGGAGTLVGPMLGTFFFVLFHKGVEALTQHWQIALGLTFVILVLAAPNGLYGGLGQFRRWVLGGWPRRAWARVRDRMRRRPRRA
jgi:branched-chain amino acid transport system permease protein